MVNLKLKEKIKKDLSTYLFKFEEGETTDRETLYLFEELANSGMAFTLQGRFGRNTAHFFKCGYFEAEPTEELEKQIGQASFDLSVSLTEYLEKWKKDELTGEESCLLFKKLIETREIYSLAKDDDKFVRAVMGAVRIKLTRLVANEEFLKQVEESK
jgi:hypothetical protein